MHDATVSGSPRLLRRGRTRQHAPDCSQPSCSERCIVFWPASRLVILRHALSLVCAPSTPQRKAPALRGAALFSVVLLSGAVRLRGRALRVAGEAGLQWTSSWIPNHGSAAAAFRSSVRNACHVPLTCAPRCEVLWCSREQRNFYLEGPLSALDGNR